MKFIVTQEVGRLATWLRILGYNTVLFRETNLNKLIVQAHWEDRIIVTRNHRLVERKDVKVVWIKSPKIREQIQETIKVLGLKVKDEDLFSWCSLCNIPVERTEKAKVQGKVPEYVYQTQENFVSCPKCQRIYWAGTHWEHAKQFIRRA